MAGQGSCLDRNDHRLIEQLTGSITRLADELERYNDDAEAEGVRPANRFDDWRDDVATAFKAAATVSSHMDVAPSVSWGEDVVTAQVYPADLPDVVKQLGQAGLGVEYINEDDGGLAEVEVTKE